MTAARQMCIKYIVLNISPVPGENPRERNEKNKLNNIQTKLEENENRENSVKHLLNYNHDDMSGRTHTHTHTHRYIYTLTHALGKGALYNFAYTQRDFMLFNH